MGAKRSLGRRNLTPDQFKYFLGKKYDREKKAHGGDRKSSGQNDHLNKTASTIATAHGTSEKTVRRAAEFARAIDAVD
jgi:hypothetical protein